MPGLTASQIAMSHTIDDIETLRENALRTMIEQVDLLTDALHALRNGSPDVTDEFLDRAITSMTRHITAHRAALDAQRAI
jgi:hypothetical protein